MSHKWKSNGEKRTLIAFYEPPKEVVRYLEDMRDAVRYALQAAYALTLRDPKGNIPSPITLRKEVKPWFAKFGYAVHHVNPVCRSAVALLRSYRKNHGKLRIPQVKKLAMRLDAELVKLEGERLRVTLQPGCYAYLPINNKNKHFQEYGKNRICEALITDRKVCVTYTVGPSEKPLGQHLMGQDLNFKSVTSTKTTLALPPAQLQSVNTIRTDRIAQIQNDFSRRRRSI
jgi:putative transposase